MLEKVLTFLRKLQTEGFFGTVTLSFQNGRVTNIEHKRTLKPEEL